MTEENMTENKISVGSLDLRTWCRFCNLLSTVNTRTESLFREVPKKRKKNQKLRREDSRIESTRRLRERLDLCS